jgi:hypothetical protein
MNHSGWRSHLVALGTALIACVYLLSLSTALVLANTITEFPIPTGSSVPSASPNEVLGHVIQ